MAVIMDGNGRWATSRGRPRLAGHRAGADALRRIVEAAPGVGIRTLTVYAFSSDNWSRPAAEVRGLMHLLREYLELETKNCLKDGVRLSFIGRRDRLPAALCRALEASERVTAQCTTLTLRVALDYSSRDVLARAVLANGASAAEAADASGDAGRTGLERRIAEAMHAVDGAPDVDLLVRTGGEQRLSDFMLWECAYAELFFSPTMWPDFSVEELGRIVQAFHGRERRFGGLAERAAS
jgi:undecaprenyl diphosphate synthase